MRIPEEKREALDSRIRLNMEEEQELLFGSREKRRFHVRREWRAVAICGIAMLVVFILSFFLCGNLLNGNFSLAWVTKYVVRRFRDLTDLLTGNRLQTGVHFFLCTFICPMLAGMGLAASGACFQALFRNPMASPTLLGIESGGSLGATVYVLFLYTPTISGLLQVSYEGYAIEYHAMTVWQKYGQYLTTFAGCIVVVVIVLILTKLSGRGKVETVPLMVGGMVFTSFISTAVTAVQYYEATVGGNSMVVEEIASLQAGSFNNIASPPLLMCFSIPVILPVIVLFLLSGRLNIIAFGEEEARLMGVKVGFDRTFLIILTTVVTAAVVAFCGNIGFVGLIVPHLARRIVGSDFRHLVPASAFLGGIFMVLAYDISYMVNGLVDTGTVINVVGGFAFVIVMLKYRRQRNADWA